MNNRTTPRALLAPPEMHAPDPQPDPWRGLPASWARTLRQAELSPLRRVRALFLLQHMLRDLPTTPAVLDIFHRQRLAELTEAGPFPSRAELYETLNDLVDLGIINLQADLEYVRIWAFLQPDDD